MEEGYIYVFLLFFILVVVAVMTGREVKRRPEKDIPPGATECPSCGHVFFPKIKESQAKPKPSKPQQAGPMVIPGGGWPTYPGGGGTPIVIYPQGGQGGGGGDE